MTFVEFPFQETKVKGTDDGTEVLSLFLSRAREDGGLTIDKGALHNGIKRLRRLRLVHQ